MEDECYEEELELCEEHSFDTFGGHTKALHGFKTYNIEGAELYNMGQVEIIFCGLPLPYCWLMNSSKSIDILTFFNNLLIGLHETKNCK